MHPYLQVVYRHLESSQALTDAIGKEVEQLAAHSGRPVHCHVTVEPEPHHSAPAKRFRVRIEATHNGLVFVSDRHPSDDDKHDNAYFAVREAFRGLRRQMDEHSHRRRALRHSQPA